MFYDSPDKQQHPDSLYKSFLSGYLYTYIRNRQKRLREHVRAFQRVSCYITMYLYQLTGERVSNIISQSNTLIYEGVSNLVSSERKSPLADLRLYAQYVLVGSSDNNQGKIYAQYLVRPSTITNCV